MEHQNINRSIISLLWPRRLFRVFSSIRFVISQYLIKDQHISGIGWSWCLAWRWTFRSYFTIRSWRRTAGRVGFCGSWSVNEGWRFAICWCRSTAGRNCIRRRLCVSVWACGIANHLIMICPDATASAIDNADALASGLRSVEKWTRKALLRLIPDGYTNISINHM